MDARPAPCRVLRRFGAIAQGRGGDTFRFAPRHQGTGSQQVTSCILATAGDTRLGGGLSCEDRQRQPCPRKATGKTRP
ncbi:MULTISPECIES: hypothetical protein [Geobacillus]|uniref:hypothetical protein n=1 Tax=Geobacillus TaxID=129337 RepID=UPI000AC7FAE2|nr:MULTISPECIES: hypothetical protein [Geobacillus]